jgi:hypothetical protein
MKRYQQFKPRALRHPKAPRAYEEGLDEVRNAVRLAKLREQRRPAMACPVALMMLLLARGAWGASVTTPPAEQTIDPERAARYFEEAEAISRGDGGRLWGVQLYGPMLFADPATRSVVANQPDGGGQLKAQGKVFVGKLPENVNIANTATSWGGVTWTMVIWPLLQDPEARAQLMIHELWHRVQASLGFPATSPANAHLDSPQGRLWLQLEWRALGRALTSTGAERRSAIQDALVFRAERRQIFPAGALEERALEMHEGLAEYTGVKLASASNQRARARAARKLHEAESRPTFVRSFAYASGPAYGLLLDETAPGWRKALKASDDFGTLLASSLSLHLPSQLEGVAEERANSYDGDGLRAAEAAREAARQRRLAEYRTRFVDGPVLIIPLRKMKMQFDPNNLQPMGELGTVYPAMRVTDLWGILTVTGGALLSPQWTEVRVPAPRDPRARPLQGDGWTLVPQEGWAAVPGERAGDYVLKPENGEP